jgi:hypothetical protein
MKKYKRKETVEHTRIVLTGNDIIRLLKQAGIVKILKDTKVIFNVPTGGDYSGVALEIDKECPIVVSGKSYDLAHIKKKNDSNSEARS